MTQLAFRHAGRPYRAEVILGPDLELDEILTVEYETASGSVIMVDDPVELEPVIEREVSSRTEELRKHRDALRSAAPSRRRPISSGDDQRWSDIEKIADATRKYFEGTIPLADAIFPVIECPHSVRDTPAQTHQEASVNLTFHSIKGTRALYSAEGIRGYIRFPVKSFDGAPVASMSIDGMNLKPAKAPVVRKPKAPLTAEAAAARIAKAQASLLRAQKLAADFGL